MREQPGLAALIIALLSLAAFFSLLERYAAAVPRKTLFRRERSTDFLYWFFTPWVSKSASMLGVAIAILVVTAVVRAAGIEHPSPRWFESQPGWLQVVELLIAADFLGYFAHRLFHGRRLWRFHAIHHSAEDLDWPEGLDRNFAGLFPWIDALFGTLYLPCHRQPQKFGVREAIPAGLLAQLAYPFTKR